MSATRYLNSFRRLGGALFLLLGSAGGLLGGAGGLSVGAGGLSVGARGAWAAQPGLASPNLASYVDKNRVLLVFARDADDPSFAAQKRIFADAEAGTRERDLVLVPALGADASELRRQFKIADGTFAALLIGKDGETKVRSGRPIASRALFLTIDSMPMRRAERKR